MYLICGMKVGNCSPSRDGCSLGNPSLYGPIKKSNSEARQRRSMGKIFWEIYQVHARNFGYDVTYVRSPVQTRLI